MKITKEVLKQIIVEEVQSTLQESEALEAQSAVIKLMKEGEIPQLMEKLGFKLDGNSRDQTEFYFVKTFEDGTRGVIRVGYKARPPRPPIQ
jgi:hypothetical protein